MGLWFQNFIQTISKSSNRLVLFWLNAQILVFASCFLSSFCFLPVQFQLAPFVEWTWNHLRLSSAENVFVSFCFLLFHLVHLECNLWIRLFNRPLIFFLLQYSFFCICVHVAALYFIAFSEGIFSARISYLDIVPRHKIGLFDWALVAIKRQSKQNMNMTIVFGFHSRFCWGFFCCAQPFAHHLM